MDGTFAFALAVAVVVVVAVVFAVAVAVAVAVVVAVDWTPSVPEHGNEPAVADPLITRDQRASRRAGRRHDHAIERVLERGQERELTGLQQIQRENPYTGVPPSGRFEIRDGDQASPSLLQQGELDADDARHPGVGLSHVHGRKRPARTPPQPLGALCPPGESVRVEDVVSHGVWWPFAAPHR